MDLILKSAYKKTEDFFMFMNRERQRVYLTVSWSCCCTSARTVFRFTVFLLKDAWEKK